jgi:hypothetical protein
MSPYELFTSIKPPANADEFAYLCDCLDSWRAAGFNPISVNGPKEIETILKLNLRIEFAPLSGDGKPRIGAIFSAVRARGNRFSRIINSDCKIVRYDDIAARLKDRLEGRLVLAWRIDLGSDLKPTTRRGGYDAFFFDANILPPDDGGFSIAEPWWDYWFPLACEMNGARLETLALPLLTHKYHPENWSRQNFINAGVRFRSLLQRWYRRGDMPESLLAKMPPGVLFDKAPPSLEQLGLLAGVPPFWLFDCRPQRIAVMRPEAGEVELMLRFGGHSLFNEVLKEAREAEFAARGMELAQIRGSTSWRMTAPLRRVVTSVRELTAAPRQQLARWSNRGAPAQRLDPAADGPSKRELEHFSIRLGVA